MPKFACVTHSKLKSWKQLRAANAHNVRAIDVPNARAEGHSPVELLDETASLDERVRCKLIERGINPASLRKNAVIACEDVFQASHEYWAERYPGGWWNESLETILADPFMLAMNEYLQKKHGDHLVSLCVHVDEKTPHVHCVSVPLVLKMHRVRGRKRKDGVVPEPVKKWSLDARTLRGGSKYRLEKEHDDWAAAVAHLGLERGERGSELSLEELGERRRRPRYASPENEKRENERKAREQQYELDLQQREKDVADGKAAVRRLLRVARSKERRAARRTKQAAASRAAAAARENDASATIADYKKQSSIAATAERAAREAQRQADREREELTRRTQELETEARRRDEELARRTQELETEARRRDEQLAEKEAATAAREATAATRGAEADRREETASQYLKIWMAELQKVHAREQEVEKREELARTREEARAAFWSGDIVGTAKEENGAPALVFSDAVPVQRRSHLSEITSSFLGEFCDWIGLQLRRVRTTIRDRVDAIERERKVADGLARAVEYWCDGAIEIVKGELRFARELTEEETVKILRDVMPAQSEATSAIIKLQALFHERIAAQDATTAAFEHGVEMLAAGVIRGSYKDPGGQWLLLFDTGLTTSQVYEAQRDVRGAEHLLGPYIKDVERKVAQGLISAADLDRDCLVQAAHVGRVGTTRSGIGMG